MFVPSFLYHAGFWCDPARFVIFTIKRNCGQTELCCSAGKFSGRKEVGEGGGGGEVTDRTHPWDGLVVLVQLGTDQQPQAGGNTLHCLPLPALIFLLRKYFQFFKIFSAFILIKSNFTKVGGCCWWRIPACRAVIIWGETRPGRQISVVLDTLFLINKQTFSS